MAPSVALECFQSPDQSNHSILISLQIHSSHWQSTEQTGYKQRWINSLLYKIPPRPNQQGSGLKITIGQAPDTLSGQT